MKLSDSAIAQIAKVLQVAILTGTDIVDNIRLMEFTVDDDKLYLDKSYTESFETNLNKMLEEVETANDSSTSQSIKARDLIF